MRGKLARPVLRGGDGGNAVSLPDVQIAVQTEKSGGRRQSSGRNGAKGTDGLGERPIDRWTIATYDPVAT